MKIADIKIGNRIRTNLGDIQALANSIKEVGLLHLVVVNEKNELVAGLRRIEAVKLLGWEEIPHCVVKTLQEATDALRGELEENTCRLDFSPSEAVAMAKTLLQLEQPKAKSRQSSHTKAGYVKFTDPGSAMNKVAEKVGMSRPTLAKAQEVVRAANEHPDCQKHLEFMDRTGNIDAAYKKTYRHERKKKLKEFEETFDKNARQEFDNVCSIEQADFRDFLKRLADQPEDQRPDALITDPDYSRQAIGMYEDLSLLASKVLKPGGIMAVLCGQCYLPDVIRALTAHMPYRWTLCYRMASGKAVKVPQKNVLIQGWKPIIVLGGTDHWIGIDVVEPKNGPSDVINVGGLDKTFHPWQQCPKGFARLLEILTNPNDLVCDPFVCTGTTAISSLRLKRRFIGCDVDAEMVPVARQRALQAWAETYGQQAEAA